VVLRVEADRVLRDAMADAGTPLIRRWLVWAAVATDTMLSGAGTGWSTALAWRYRLTAALTVAVIAVLGVVATLDMLDVDGAPALPWMGHRSWPVELVGGLAGAFVVPLVLALLWGRFRIAGAVVGVSLAVLLHVTVALLALTLLYRALEWVAATAPMLALVLLGLLTAAALATFLSVLV
jgi:hypothetical protein